MSIITHSALALTRLARASVGVTEYVYESEFCDPPATANCCIFVHWLFDQIGIVLPKEIEEQQICGQAVLTVADIQLGDLCFFTTRKAHGHVALFLSHHEVIHACWRSQFVVAESLRTLTQRYELAAIRRVL